MEIYKYLMNYFFPNKKLIVAEIGNNHEGSFITAKKLILKAKEAGVDAVKFQTFKTENYINKKNKKRFNLLKKFELSNEEFFKLSVMAKKIKLKFISTPFDFDSANFLSKIVDYFKISSGDNNFNNLIKMVLSKKKPTMISTGILNLKEIDSLIKLIKQKINKKNFCLLHCVSAYPVKLNEANLFVLDYLKQKRINFGYSDHTIGGLSAIVASIKGAQVIEKHFTLDNNFSSFRDHQISLNPINMKKLVDDIRDVEKLCMNKYKKYSKDEKKNVRSMRRSIYANQSIQKGQIINENNIKIVRPFVEIQPNDINKILGKKAKKNISSNQAIRFTYLK